MNGTPHDPHYAAPSGPHRVGVRDGEVVDTAYPTARPGEEEGRRLMLRTWYPAHLDPADTTPTRPYLVGDEIEVLRWALVASVAPAEWIEPFASLRTYAVQDAPVADGSFPTVVFNHGATGWVFQNTALMEHLASHGYVVWSIAHPGEASAVRYAEGDTVRYDDDFLSTFIGVATDPAFQVKFTGGVAERLAAAPHFVDDRGMGPWSQRWVDDTRAVIDALASATVTGAAAPVAGVSDLDKLGSVGMSFGAAAAASAAQQDDRVRVAVNLDGGQFLSDLLDTEIRVPLLQLTGNVARWLASAGIHGATTLDVNEFFFEPVRDAGTVPHVRRFYVEDVTHLELTDLVLVDRAERSRVLPLGGRVDAQRTIDVVNRLIRGHLDEALTDADAGTFDAALAETPEVHPIDLGPLREWARQQEVAR